MADVYGAALLLDETEIGVLVGSSSEKVFGFELNDVALSPEGRARGVNSLIRRGLLKSTTNGYTTVGEYSDVLRAIISPKAWCSIECVSGFVYCGEAAAALIRPVSSEPPGFCTSRVDEISLSTLLIDEGFLPAKDEDGFMSRGIPEDDELLTAIGNDKDKLCICSGESGKTICVLRIGLCMVLAVNDGVSCSGQPYSRTVFEKKLSELMKGRLVEL